MNIFSIFSPPKPFVKTKKYRYPRWEFKTDDNSSNSTEYKLSVLDFDVSLDDSIKTKIFDDFEESIQYRMITNDGCDQSLIWLTMARNIFHKELAQMPEDYISKLVYNKYHYTVVLIKDGMVFGGICYRPFFDRDFIEIAFCAVTSTSQVSGFGSHLMAKVKTYIQVLDLHNILTYADNSAVGYFKGQGFTLDINLDPKIWKGCIKDYQGATLIHCIVYDNIDYLHLFNIIDNQLREASHNLPTSRIHQAYVWPMTYVCGFAVDRNKPKTSLANKMRIILDQTKQHRKSWPFRKPVSDKEAPKYSETIKKPMDLMTLENNVNDGKYSSFEEFIADLMLIFSNCYEYNGPDTIYSKTAVQLEEFVTNLLQSYVVRKRD